MFCFDALGAFHVPHHPWPIIRRRAFLHLGCQELQNLQRTPKNLDERSKQLIRNDLRRCTKLQRSRSRAEIQRLSRLALFPATQDLIKLGNGHSHEE